MKLMFTLLLALLCNPANAIVLTNLYSTEIVVQDNTDATRIANLELALEQMALKVASNKQILEHEELIRAKSHADNYVSSYSYKANDGVNILTVKFNDNMVDQLLVKTGRQLLGKNRPQVLVWVTSNLPHSEIKYKLDLQAKGYGIPMLVPSLELPNVELNAQQIKELAKKHNADLILRAKILEVNNELLCSWQILDDLPGNAWQSNGIDLDTQLEAMLNNLSDQLLLRFSPNKSHVAQGEKQYILQVHGINNAKDYAKINNYLKSITCVKQLEIQDIINDVAIFRIISDSDKKSLASALTLDKILLGDNDNLDNSQFLAYKANL